MDDLHIPPHSIEAEQAVLGALMLAPSALASVDDWLNEADFYRADHRMIYRAVRTLIGRQQAVDALTLADWFEAEGLLGKLEGPNYFIELASNTPSAANIVAYGEIVAEKARLRSLIDVGTALTSGAFSRQGDASLLIGDAQHRLAQLQPAGLRGGLLPAKTALAEVFQDMVARHAAGPGLIGLPTPWESFNAWSRGLEPGLYIVAARPSMGKTVFAVTLATFVALMGKRTGFFTVEQTAKQIMKRAVACVAQVPFKWVKEPDDCEDSDVYWARTTGAFQRLNDSPLLIDETPGLRRGQLRARVMRAHRQAPLDLIVIDHLHDMGDEDREEKRISIGRNVQVAKDLAKVCRCPVILMAQLNRNLKDRADKRPTMTDLRESGDIEQKADVIMFLHREEYYDRDTHLKGVVELLPGKGRDLELGQSIYLQNRFDQMRMDDWDGPLPEAPAHDTGHRSHGPRWGGQRRGGGFS